MFSHIRQISPISVNVLLITLLSACGGGGGSSTPPPPTTYNVNVTVTGVSGSGLILQNNSGDNLTISADGTFSFSTPLADASNYAVTIQTQPSTPNQTCSVTNGSGVISNSDVSNISVSCITNTYTISGTVSGLAGANAVIQNNAGDDLSLTVDGSFSFTTALDDLSSYAVTVNSHPTGQLCTVSNGSGTLTGSNINNVSISCATAYTVGGTVSGLTSQGLVLQNNATDNLSIAADGAFVFNTPLLDSSTYSVTVFASPLGPKQTCSVTNGSGSITTTNVSNVNISCANATKYQAGTFYSTHFGNDRTIGIASGDIDGDGDLDVITAHSNEPNGWPNAIWLNDGTGSGNIYGVSPVQTFGNSDSRAVELADIDGDSDLDILVGNNGANTVWINQGGAQAGTPGNFVDSGQALGTANTASIAIGDLDNDGDIDMVSGNSINDHEIWLNDGSGNFGATPAYTFSESSSILQKVVLADMDGDADLDIVEANEDINGLVIWINQGGAQAGTIATFVNSGQAFGLDTTRAVAAGDIDNDGDMDVVTGHWNETHLWINNGTGTLSDSGQLFDDTDIGVLRLHDLDADGDLDLFAGSDWSQPHKIWTNQGGNFTDSGQFFQSGSNTHDVDIADIDGDGDPDIVEGYYYGNLMWLNDGAGVMADPLQHFENPTGNWTRNIELADIDLDGDLDVVEANVPSGYGVASNTVWLNDGTGDLGDTPSQTLGYDETEGLAMGDLNGDNYPDIIEINMRDTNVVRLNNGDGTFSQHQTFGTSTAWSQSVNVADIDGDGDLDAIEGFAGGSNKIWLNDGTGTLTDSGQGLTADWTYSIAVGDIDGDGDIDIIFGESAKYDGLWINQGGAQGGTEGIFLESAQMLGSTYITESVAMGDLDNDGDLDLVFGYSDGFYSTPGDAIWYNQGGLQGGTEGVFVDSGIYSPLGGVNTKSIALGDVDDDGDLDIVKGSQSRDNTVWFNQGGDQAGTLGTFLDSGQSLGGGNWTYDIELGDMDGDGDLDIVDGIAQHPNLVYKNMTYWP